MSAVTGKRALGVVLVIAVAAAVTAGIVIIGSPTEERTRRLDERRVEDLRRISASARLYHTRHNRLPGSLTELAGEPGIALQPADPATGAPYGYRVVDSGTFELCATFERVSTSRGVAGFWSHGAGRQCFALAAKESK